MNAFESGRPRLSPLTKPAHLECPLCVKSYDAIICDQRMPGVNGQSLFRMVEALDPELAKRFIFVTGDVLNEHTREFFAQTGTKFVQKPFRLDDLLQAVETVLN